MNALTLKHPWAVAIRDWGKPVENRTWKPPRSLIGQWFAIHGGVVPKGRARDEAFTDLMSLIGQGLAPRNVPTADAIVPGILCVVRLDRVVQPGDDDPIVSSPWFTGPYGWVLSDVVPMPEPIPCSGRQGLWPLLEDVLAKVRDGWQRTKGGVLAC